MSYKESFVGGRQCYVLSVGESESLFVVQSFVGGRQCYVLSVGESESLFVVQ